MENHLESNVLISICIATYNREKMLENLLNSLIHQKLPENIYLEIIVTDNDSNGSALSIVKKFPNTERFHFKFFIQPSRNISITRNVCVENSTGQFICFIDDDETASETWVKSLYETMIKYYADGVFGYVKPIFDKNIPNHFHKREFYFSEVGETGTKAKFYFTTNAMIKSELIKSEEIPFDPNYGLTGGEDVHLFERLERKGAKFVINREAVSYEYIPFERGTKKYLFNRALRGGQAYLRRTLERKNNLSFKGIIITKIFLRLLYGFFLLSFYPFSKKKSILGVLSMGDAIGKSRALFMSFKEIY